MSQGDELAGLCRLGVVTDDEAVRLRALAEAADAARAAAESGCCSEAAGPRPEPERAALSFASALVITVLQGLERTGNRPDLAYTTLGIVRSLAAARLDGLHSGDVGDLRAAVDELPAVVARRDRARPRSVQEERGRGDGEARPFGRAVA